MELIDLKSVMAYFGMSMGQFGREWKQLTETDRTQIRTGLSDGTFTY